MSETETNEAIGDGETWEVGFEGHEIAQLRRIAKMPFSKKLEWLEEAHHLALRLQAAKRCRIVPNTESK